MGIKLKAQHETDLFINDNGYFAIKQESFPDDPSVVELTPSQMRSTIEAMKKALKIQAEWWIDAVSDGDF